MTYLEQFKDRAGQLHPLGDHGKARRLIEHGAVEVEPPPSLAFVAPGQALVCVVDNGTFESAAWVATDQDFTTVTRPDWRTRVWLEIDRDLAVELSGR